MASTANSLVLTFGDIECYTVPGGHDLVNAFDWEDENWRFTCAINIYPSGFVLAEAIGEVTNKKDGSTRFFWHQVPTDFDTQYPPLPIELDENGNFESEIAFQDMKRTPAPGVGLMLRGTVLLTDIGDPRPVTDVLDFRVIAVTR